MEQIFKLNPTISPSDLHDAIDERITKARAITACLLSTNEAYFSYEIACETIWAIDGLLEELAILCERSCK